MFSALRSERTTACISDMRFDAWHGEELTAQQIDELRRHLASCRFCRRRQLQLERGRARFAAAEADLPRWLAGSPPPRRRRGWIAIAASATVAAGAAVVALALVPGAPTVRTKGREYVSFYWKRGQDVQRGRLRETLQPGDLLRFAYTAMQPRYLTILSLDGAGHASVYYPAGERASPIAAGTEVLLPSAVELDGVLGEERIVALFCDDAVPVAPLRAALEAGRLEPAGCTRDELVVVKQASGQ